MAPKNKQKKASKKTSSKEKKTKRSTTSKAKQHASPKTESLLLGVTPEIRNLIYREVLVSSAFVQIKTTDGYHQHPLLQTCSQIRDETQAIYYEENCFLLPMQGYNSTPGMKWLETFMVINHEEPNYATWSPESGGEKWDDLLTGLSRYHSGEVPGWSELCSHMPCDEEAEAMFEEVDESLGVP